MLCRQRQGSDCSERIEWVHCYCTITVNIFIILNVNQKVLVLFYFIFLFLCVFGCVSAIVDMLRPKDNVQELVFFHRVVPRGSNSGHQAWQNVPLSAEPSPWLERFHFKLLFQIMSQSVKAFVAGVQTTISSVFRHPSTGNQNSKDTIETMELLSQIFWHSLFKIDCFYIFICVCVLHISTYKGSHVVFPGAAIISSWQWSLPSRSSSVESLRWPSKALSPHQSFLPRVFIWEDGSFYLGLAGSLSRNTALNKALCPLGSCCLHSAWCS